MKKKKKNYADLKIKYPDAIIWFLFQDFVETFSDSAETTADVLQIPLTNRPDNGLLLCGFQSIYLDNNIRKMIKSGYKIALVDGNHQLDKYDTKS